MSKYYHCGERRREIWEQSQRAWQISLFQMHQYMRPLAEICSQYTFFMLVILYKLFILITQEILKIEKVRISCYSRSYDLCNFHKYQKLESILLDIEN